MGKSAFSSNFIVLSAALAASACTTTQGPGMDAPGATVCTPGDVTCAQQPPPAFPGTAGAQPAAGSGGVGAPIPAGSSAPMGGMMGPAPVAEPALPCGVQQIVASRCLNCHGETPIGGAPMPLVTHDDFHGAAFTDASRKVFEMVHTRVNDDARPMPPGNKLMDPELTAFNDWLAAGAPAAGAGEICGGETGGAGGAGGMGGSGGTGSGWGPPQGEETCYELVNHGGQTADDTSKYMVEPGENYEQFYFRAPWTSEARGTRFGTRFDNVQVLHHWLLYTSSKSVSLHGTHETVIGTVLDDPGSTLLAGWAVGGQDVLAMPDNVEFELPPPGTLLNAQWHLWNNTDVPQPDGSAILLCTVPPGTRDNVAAVTWLGTENFNGPVGMPPGFRGEFDGTCLNDSGGPITIFDVTPHMHEIGRHMRAVVTRANGMQETVFDMPFDFNFQINYKTDIVLQPGDQITTYCTFENNTNMNVPFGPSSKQEMCYLFANSYPAGELSNGVLSLAGATNTCW